MELDLDLDHLLLVLAANKAVEVSDEVVFLEEGVGAVLALIGDEVFVMNLNMLLHVVELSELFVATCALKNLVVATSSLVQLAQFAVTFFFLANLLVSLNLAFQGF